MAVGADGVTSITAILPTAGTQVARTASSSATLQGLEGVATKKDIIQASIVFK